MPPPLPLLPHPWARREWGGYSAPWPWHRELFTPHRLGALTALRDSWRWLFMRSLCSFMAGLAPTDPQEPASSWGRWILLEQALCVFFFCNLERATYCVQNMGKWLSFLTSRPFMSIKPQARTLRESAWLEPLVDHWRDFGYFPCRLPLKHSCTFRDFSTLDSIHVPKNVKDYSFKLESLRY